jgi:hypothetical protein
MANRQRGAGFRRWLVNAAVVNSTSHTPRLSAKPPTGNSHGISLRETGTETATIT